MELLSIIIPTKNRYGTLIPVIDAILKRVKSDDYELIVQDNSECNDEFMLYLTENISSRLKYFYNSNSISITENTINAIDNSNGKYLIFIGDDDILTPNICDYIKLINESDIDCLIYNPGYYWWNNVKFNKETFYHRNNALWIPEKLSNKLEKLNSENELNLVLNNGASGVMRLPRFYHGIVKRDVLNKIKLLTGTFLPGSCPDIAFATAIALTIKEYYYVDFPISIYGASKNSGGGLSASNKHYGKIEDQEFLPKNILEIWDPLIPRIWSECTIYPQSVYEVQQAFKVNRKINYIAFYATMLSRESHLNIYTIPIVKKYCGRNIIKYFMICIVCVKRFGGKYYRDFRIKSKKFGYNVEIVKDIDHVMDVLGSIKI
jgi:glycosyltransferase involved in cell wall biosynthesis